MNAAVSAAIPPAPPLAELVGDAGGWALFLDFDGTLVDLAATPDAIRVPADLPVLLRRLGERFDGALAILTGRALANLDRHLPGLALPAAGQHGAERRLRPGQRAVVAAVPALAVARREIANFQTMHPALLVEDKGASAALHYRAAPELRERIVAFAERIVAASGGRLEAIEGKCVCEFRPAGSDKGSALSAFLALPPFAGRRPLAMGDDVTDEAAFAAALAAGGAAVKVGEGETRAPWRLPSPEKARAWLAACLDR